MIFKIDTKEKFTVITSQVEDLSDNLTAELEKSVNDCLQKDIKNIVINLRNVQTIDDSSARKLASLQQTFYENGASFIICEVQPPVERKLDELELLEIMNITPTESEAWDIVQMEEIERELLDDGEPSFNSHEE